MRSFELPFGVRGEARHLLFVGITAFALAGCSGTARHSPAAGEALPLPSISTVTAKLEKRPGLLPFYLDARRGKIWLKVPAPGPHGVIGDYLYVEGLASGLGSNPVGLDRGQLGESKVVRLRRLGPRLVIEVVNLRYRASSPDAAESTAVRESFATSVLWAADVAAEDRDGRGLVDFTTFVVRDAHGVAARLKAAGQGTFTLDLHRSAIDLDRCLAFPDNIEMEALLTYQSDAPGALVQETAPVAQAVSLVQHHSLVRLPDDGYRPRRFDPREGSFAIDYLDYAADLDAPLRRRWIVRHRLQKIDPGAASSPVKEPIIYYVDRGVPEPIRSALIEGASWWKEAFEKAGFEDAFRVELLPEGADPLDVRYNVIQWVHRSTRGWSYGGGVVDPRTGEMIKGHVSLGSLRVRQDRLLLEGLAGTQKTGTGTPDDPVQLALARIRQLAAHEVGHTLGLAHNFAASTYGGRASVMDYPAPLVDVDSEGHLDFSRAYAVGMGSWDIHAIDYAYREFPPGVDEDSALQEITRQGLADGLLFIGDHDARPAGSAHPRASLWDNGEDPVAELDRTFRVRRIALDSFGQANVRPGTPLSLLQEVFTTVYLHHRYQLQAAAKSIGGLEFTYAVRGDGQPPARPVDGDRQRAALAAVVRAIDPSFLDVPESTLALLMPRPFGYEDPDRENFESATAPAFDALGACATAADLVVRALLQPERCARLVDFHRRAPELPGLEDVLDALIKTAFDAHELSARHEAVREMVQRVVTDRMIDLSARESTPAAVRARVDDRLAMLQRELERRSSVAGAPRAHFTALVRDIHRYLEQRTWEGPQGWRPADAPPGEPIGSRAYGLSSCGFFEATGLRSAMSTGED